ncbi:MAG: Calx-beta domain-containing protein [Chloroflexota bacterium]
MRRSWRIGFFVALFIVVTLVVGGTAVGLRASSTAATPLDISGYLDHGYASGVASTGAPTAEKPQSKLWHHDGFWWGSLWSDDGNAYHIYKLDWDTQTWSDTGIVLDDRKDSRADVLSDGDTLYVVSHVYSFRGGAAGAGDRTELFRYSYSGGTYTLDAGFPVEVNEAETKSLTIAKDSTGTLWITWLEDDNVMINHSNATGGGDADWATPFELPGSDGTAGDQDISSIVSFNGNIGVMWSTQRGGNNRIRFAAHADGDPVNTWSDVIAYDISGDDHINLKTLHADDAGKIFAAAKTSLGAHLIILLVCDGASSDCTNTSDWTAHDVYDGTYGATRPLVMLDTSNRDIYVFARLKDLPTDSGADIYFKRTKLDDISFEQSGAGEPFIASSDYTDFNDPTSTKQNVTSSTGLIVMANDDRERVYAHYCVDLGSVQSDICLTPDLGAEVSLDSATYEASEAGGTDVTITATLSNEVPAETQVDFTITPNSATSGEDYNAASGTLVFPPNVTSQTITISLLDDILDESDETLAIELSNGVGLALVEPFAATVTILDDDEPPTVQLAGETFAIPENGGPQTMTVTLSAPSGQPIFVNFDTSDDTAVSGDDYTAVSETLAFAVGETEQTVDIPILDDVGEEELESFNVALSNVANATLGTPDTATVTIQDDDAAPLISFEAAFYTVDEAAGTAVVPVTLVGVTDKTVTVDVTSGGNDATPVLDYDPISTTLSFAPGETVKNIEITIVDDQLDESGESIELTLSNLVNGDPGLLLETEVEIDDNDQPPTLAFSSADFVADESDGTATITVQLSAPSDRTASVDFEASDGTALAGLDYQPITGTLSFPAGTLTQTFEIELIDNDQFEATETVILSLLNPSKSDLGEPSVATLSITDADGLPTLSFRVSEIEVAEGAGKVSIPVVLSEAVGITASVDYVTIEGTATAGSDFTHKERPLFIVAGDDSAQIDVPLFDDLHIEGPETFRVELSNPSNVGLGSTRVVTVTLIDDDLPVIDLVETDFEVNENHGDVEVELTLDTTSPFSITVDYMGEDQTAVFGEDHNVMTGTVTFPPNTMTQTLTLPIIDDILDESSESFAVHFMNPQNANLGASDSLTVTLKDNDEKSRISFVQSTYSFGENDGEVDIELVLDKPAGRLVKVVFATVDGTAVGDVDYETEWKTIRFEPGVTSVMAEIELITDNLVEGDETFQLILGDPDDGELGDIRSTIVTIIDEDEAEPEIYTLYLPVTVGE